MKDTCFIIVNPKSGSGSGLKRWNKVVMQTLAREKIPYKAVFTAYQNHATHLAIEAIKTGFRHIVAMGGDGTLHEVMNGILQQTTVSPTDVTLSIIPVGTGNDWIKTLNIPLQIAGAIDIIKNGKTYIQDIGVATYYEAEQQKKRYFLNVGGTGFDAFVAKKIEYSKAPVKIYLLELLKGLTSYHNTPVSIKSKERALQTSVFTVNVSICKYFGSGMLIAPEAVPNDGWLDVTLIKNISKLGVFMELRNLYNGAFVNNPHIETFRTKSISVESTKDIYLQLDGELLGHGPIDFNIIPNALKVKVPSTN